MKSLQKELLELSEEIINEYLNSKYSLKHNESPGVKNGSEIILQYLEKSEFGLALKHLEYIISECVILLNMDQEDKLRMIYNKIE